MPLAVGLSGNVGGEGVKRITRNVLKYRCTAYKEEAAREDLGVDGTIILKFILGK
jgi:hypothetical protein